MFGNDRIQQAVFGMARFVSGGAAHASPEARGPPLQDDGLCGPSSRPRGRRSPEWSRQSRVSVVRPSDLSSPNANLTIASPEIVIRSNPHAGLYVNVRSDDGTVTEWGFELSSPSLLRPDGVSPNTGDRAKA